jgi:hypothetical protein
MAFDAQQINAALPASADLSASQFCFMKLSTGKLAVATSKTADIIVGVLQDKPAAADRVGTVTTFGITKIKIGTGPLTAGAVVSTDGAGKAIAVSTNDLAQGVLLTGGATGETATMMFTFNPGAKSI